MYLLVGLTLDNAAFNPDKEKASATMNTLRYLQSPRLMIIELVHFCVMWMKESLVKLGVSKKWSAREN